MADKYMYRFSDHAVCIGTDEYGDSLGSMMEVYLTKYRILRETARGAWVERFLDKPRFVLNESRKKFACRTVEEAKESFLARKRAQERILKSRIARVYESMRKVESHSSLRPCPKHWPETCPVSGDVFCARCGEVLQ